MVPSLPRWLFRPEPPRLLVAASASHSEAPDGDPEPQYSSRTRSCINIKTFFEILIVRAHGLRNFSATKNPRDFHSGFIVGRSANNWCYWRVHSFERDREISYLQTVVQKGVDNFHGKTRGAVQAVPLCIIRRTRVHVECDIRPVRRRRRPWFWRWTRRASVYRQNNNCYIFLHLHRTPIDVLPKRIGQL